MEFEQKAVMDFIKINFIMALCNAIAFCKLTLVSTSVIIV